MFSIVVTMKFIIKNDVNSDIDIAL